MTVGVVDACTLVRFGFGDGIAGLTLGHVGSGAVLQEAWQLYLWRLVLQGLVRTGHATEVREGVARVVRIIEVVVDV